MIKSKHISACFFVELVYLDSIFYDINSEVDSYVPHTKNSASRISNESTSNNTISKNGGKVNKINQEKSRIIKVGLTTF